MSGTTTSCNSAFGCTARLGGDTGATLSGSHTTASGASSRCGTNCTRCTTTANGASGFEGRRSNYTFRQTLERCRTIFLTRFRRATPFRTHTTRWTISTFRSLCCRRSFRKCCATYGFPMDFLTCWRRQPSRFGAGGDVRTRRGRRTRRWCGYGSTRRGFGTSFGACGFTADGRRWGYATGASRSGCRVAGFGTSCRRRTRIGITGCCETAGYSRWTAS